MKKSILILSIILFVSLTSCKLLFTRKVETWKVQREAYSKIINKSFIGNDTLLVNDNITVVYMADSSVHVGKVRNNKKFGEWYIFKGDQVQNIIKYKKHTTDTIYHHYDALVNSSW